MRNDPAITVEPEKTIMPVYDPSPLLSKAPATGPPTRDLEHALVSDTPTTIRLFQVHTHRVHPNTVPT